jgi:hypothetical protein
MHLRRGLWRLWIAGSAAWIAFVTFDAIYFCAGLPASRCDPGIRLHLEWALGVPLGVLAAFLVIWIAVWWIVAGFQGR